VTVVLTGATGFVGLHLLRGLLARHDRVAVLARAEPSTSSRRVAGWTGGTCWPGSADDRAP
jgi:uncharacterized protein YbjT (DUF2867 family)